ncbi:MAG: hypothetical protein ACRDIB_14675, partial [Ardenticatenaceae bacterium]
WLQAAEALEQARVIEPHNPLLAWEAGLVYEQMVGIVDSALRIPLVAELARGEVEAPATPIDTPFCQQTPQSCYMGETSFTLPFAGLTGPPAEDTPTLFLHPPATLRKELTIPPEQSALTFWLGLDSHAADWNSDGATFHVWIEPAGAPAEIVYEHALDRTLARQGWVAGWADLSPWAGQTVILVLGTGPGPAGDTTSDWYGWGNVSLTTVEAARYLAWAPAARQWHAWQSDDFDADHFLHKGD